jgi:hypothetical protein
MYFNFFHLDYQVADHQAAWLFIIAHRWLISFNLYYFFFIFFHLFFIFSYHYQPVFIELNSNSIIY